jgi:hypothetical protein
MRVLVSIVLVGYTIFSMWSSSREPIRAAIHVTDLSQEVQEARRIMGTLAPCREEALQYCAHENLPQDVASCLQSVQAQLGASCTTALRQL